MKKRLSILFLMVTIVIPSFCQIKKVEIGNGLEFDDTTYDSLSNDVGNNIHHYLGQKLYLNCNQPPIKNYRSFYSDPSTKEVYHDAKDNYHRGSNQEVIAGNTFLVIDTLSTPYGFAQDELTYYLKLINLDLEDTAYYEYGTYHRNRIAPMGGSSFPFVTIGYYEKLKEIKIGKTFKLDDKDRHATEFPNGNQLIIEAGKKLKCIDVVITDDCELSLILKMGETEIVEPLFVIERRYRQLGE